MQDWFSNINWQVWWQPKELLMATPPVRWELMWGYVGFLGFSLLVLIAVTVFRKKLHPNLRNRLQNWALTQVSLGIALMFFRYYRIPYLGMDLWRALQEISALAWLIWIVAYARTALPLELIKETAIARREKYLPKAKK